MVIAAAKTGKEIIKRKATTNWATINKGYWKKENLNVTGRKKIVVTKLIEDKILLAPAKCKEKIIKSVETEGAAGNEL